jgi:hypothetical protein
MILSTQAFFKKMSAYDFVCSSLGLVDQFGKHGCNFQRQKYDTMKQMHHEDKCNEEPAKLNRDVALRAVRPNSLFSKVIFS